jgi:hypothetical protein
MLRYEDLLTDTASALDTALTKGKIPRKHSVKPSQAAADGAGRLAAKAGATSSKGNHAYDQYYKNQAWGTSWGCVPRHSAIAATACQRLLQKENKSTLYK